MKKITKILVLSAAMVLGCTGQAWASKTYYSQLKATGGKTGVGYVYASIDNTATPDWTTEKSTDKHSSETSQKEDEFYAWQQACRGSVFKSWSGSGTSSISGSSNPYTIKVKESNSNGDTNTGTGTATWTTYKPCTVYLHSSPDGGYSLSYKYTDYYTEETQSGTTKGFKEYTPDAVKIDANGDQQTVNPLYYTDVITLTVNKGTILGWYQNSDYTTALDGVTDNGNGTYTFKVPANTTNTTERHIYPKFQSQPKRYGKVCVKYVTGNISEAGQVAITNDKSVTPSYTASETDLTQTTILETEVASVLQDYYLYAKLNDETKYAFAGWYSSSTPSSSTLLSTNAEYTYSFNASGTTLDSPTEKTVYAWFVLINAHYFEMTAQSATAGQGMVYVSQENESSPDYSFYTSSSQSTSEATGPSNKAVSSSFYLYAKPKYGYQFAGWYADAACSGSAVSSANPYTYSASATSTDPNNPDKKTLYAKFVKASPISITFANATGGTYGAKALDVVVNEDGEYEWGETSELYNSTGKTAAETVQLYPTSNLILTAVPNSGNAVKSWTIAGTSVTSGSNNYTATATDGKTYGVTFGESKPYKVGSTLYTNLDAAISAAGSSGTILVVENATVPAKETAYNIPSGVTLLVPNNSSRTSAIGTTADRVYSRVTPTPYICLTLESGAVLNVSGVLEVSCQENCHGQGEGGIGNPSGPYGQIDMKNGSQINMKSGSRLQAWGFITGAGQVTAESGSSVYEMIQIMDWKGGSASIGMVVNSDDDEYKILPISQYAVQNIEAPIQFQYGSQELVSTGAHMSVDLKVTSFEIYENADNVAYIGSGSTGLFRLTNGATVEKKYDYANDKQIYTINGNASLNDFELKFDCEDYSSFSVDMNTQYYRLPLMNNYVVNVESGTTTLNNNKLEMTAGSEVNIASGATVSIPTGKELTLYDAAQWGSTYAYSGKATHSVPYSPTRKKKHGIADAKLCVEGTLTIGGSLYTTWDGAAIVSTNEHSGTIKFTSATPTSNIKVYQYTTASSDAKDGQTATPGKLQNADKSYTETKGDAAGTTYQYFLGAWDKALTTSGCFTSDSKGRTCLQYNGGYQQVSESSVYSAAWQSVDAASVLYVHTANGTCDWLKVNVVEGTETTSKLLKDPETNKYYQYSSTNGYWVEAPSYTLTFKNYNDKVLKEDKIYPDGTPTYSGTTPVRPDDDSGSYTFIGWKVNGAGETVTTLPTVNANTYYVAQYKCTPYAVSVNAMGLTSYYTTWAAALSAVNGTSAASTMKLLADVTGLTASQSLTQAITLDLNGHKLSGSAAKLLNVNGQTVSITDNSGTNAGAVTTTGNYAVYATTGTLKVDAGKYSSSTQELGKESAASLSISNGYFVHNAGLEASNLAAGARILTLATTTTEYTEGYRYGVSDHYTVTFNANGHGTAPASQSVKYGTAITQPAALSCTGYTFGGWYQEAGCTNTWDFSTTMPAQDKTLYAKWTANQYTLYYDDGYTNLFDASVVSGTSSGVTFTNSNGYVTMNGELTASTSNYISALSGVSAGDEVQLSISDFSGSRNNGNGCEVLDMCNTSGNNPGTRQNLDFQTSETSRQFTVVDGYNNVRFWVWYNSASCTFTNLKFYIRATKLNKQTIKYDGSISHPAVTKTGYQLEGWYSAVSGGTKYTATTYTTNGNTTLHAHWAPNQYYVSFAANGGTGTMGNQTFNYDESQNLTANKYTGPGYTVLFDANGGSTVASQSATRAFKNWSGNSSTYSDKASVYNWATENGATIALTAQWGDGTTTLPAAPTRAGYKFTGWSNGGNTYEAGKSVTISADNTTFTAQWEAQMVSYTEQDYLMDVNGNYPTTPTTSTPKSGTTDTQVAAPAEKTGFTIVTTETPTINGDGSTVVSYKYERNKYDIKWVVDGQTLDGTTFTNGKTFYEATITQPTQPKKTGYQFAGWEVSHPSSSAPARAAVKKSVAEEVPATVPAENTTFTAQWSANTYTVQFAAGEGTGSMSDQSFTYDLAQNLSPMTLTAPSYTVTFNTDGGSDVSSQSPTRPFTGWSGSNGKNYTDEQSVSNLTTEQNGTVSLTAQWGNATITLPAAPTRDDYKFLGWSDGATTYAAGATYTVSKNITLTAQWVQPITVYYSNGTSAEDVDRNTWSTIQGSDPNALAVCPNATWAAGQKNVLAESNGSYTCKTFTLADKKSFTAPFDFTAENASYSRTMSNTWGTICLPYAVSSNSAVQYYEFASIDEAGENMEFSKVTDVPANTPVLFQRLTSETSVPANASNVTVEKHESGDLKGSNPVWTLVGTLTQQYLYPRSTEAENMYYIATDHFWKLSDNTNDQVSMPPFRAYFKYNGTQSAPFRYGIVVVDHISGEVTAIDEMDAKGNGQETEKFWQNGKLYIRHNNRIYNAAGALIK